MACQTCCTTSDRVAAGHERMQDPAKRTLGNLIPVCRLLLAALEEVGHGVRCRVAVIRIDLETCALARATPRLACSALSQAESLVMPLRLDKVQERGVRGRHAPLMPSSMISAGPPLLVAKVGRPQVMSSMTCVGQQTPNNQCGTSSDALSVCQLESRHTARQ